MTDSSFFNQQPVKKGLYSPIRIRFDTALRVNKKQWFEVYKEIGLSKSHASQIRNGHIIPPPALRIKIASVIDVDTSILWDALDIISADRIRAEQQAPVKSGGL